MPSIDKEALEAAAAATDDDHSQADRVTLSNGIVLRIKPVPFFLVQDAVMRLQRPKPPKIFLEDKGREEENPADPAYRKAMDEYEASTANTALNVALITGTDVLDISEGMVGPEDDAWLEVPELFGIEIDRNNPRKRYLAWLRYHALTSSDDLFALSNALRGKLGLTEEEVQAMADSFRGRALRGTDNKLSAETVGHGDNLQTRAARRRATRGGTGGR